MLIPSDVAFVDVRFPSPWSNPADVFPDGLIPCSICAVGGYAAALPRRPVIDSTRAAEILEHRGVVFGVSGVDGPLIERASR